MSPSLKKIVNLFGLDVNIFGQSCRNAKSKSEIWAEHQLQRGKSEDLRLIPPDRMTIERR
eukprot:1493826-Rhodomonas_salina.2